MSDTPNPMPDNVAELIYALAGRLRYAEAVISQAAMEAREEFQKDQRLITLNAYQHEAPPMPDIDAVVAAYPTPQPGEDCNCAPDESGIVTFHNSWSHPERSAPVPPAGANREQIEALLAKSQEYMSPTTPPVWADGTLMTLGERLSAGFALQQFAAALPSVSYPTTEQIADALAAADKQEQSLGGEPGSPHALALAVTELLNRNGTHQ